VRDEVGEVEDAGEALAEVRREHRLERGGQRPEVDELDEQRAQAPQRGDRDQRHRVGEVQRQVVLRGPRPIDRVGHVLGDVGDQDRQREAARAEPVRRQHRQRDRHGRRDQRRDVLAGELLQPARIVARLATGYAAAA
jgi:hypothetical protein